jgi:hypothetical protein
MLYTTIILSYTQPWAAARVLLQLCCNTVDVLLKASNFTNATAYHMRFV